MTILRSLAVLSIPAALLLGGCAEDEVAETTDTSEETTAPETTAAEAKAEDTAKDVDTIVDVAASNPDFSTLVDLVGQAGLADALSGEGPFTVFAPTNEAFAKVDAATLSALAADPTGALADVLKLHVVSGKIMAADAVAANGTSIETLGGGKLKVEVVDGEVMVGGSKVVQTDIETSNGVIHVLDSVITAANG